MSNEEGPRNIISFAVRHEQRVQTCHQFIFNFVEILRLVVLRHNHAIKHLHRIIPQLVVVAQAQIHYLSNQWMEENLITLDGIVNTQTDKTNFGMRTPYRIAGSPVDVGCSAQPKACHNVSRMEAPSPRMAPAN